MTDRGHEASYDCPWMVVYPRGDRTRLTICQVRWYEKDDWDLASEDVFLHEYDARDYMLELAHDFSLEAIDY